MQNLDTLLSRYDELESLIQTAEQNRKDIYSAQRQRQAKVLEKFFTPEEGDTIKYGHCSVEISSTNSNDSFMTIYVNDNCNDNDEKEYTGLYVSSFSFRSVYASSSQTNLRNSDLNCSQNGSEFLWPPNVAIFDEPVMLSHRLAASSSPSDSERICLKELA